MINQQEEILRSKNKELERDLAEKNLELEQKNHELKVEAALERVRARTMAMQKSDELPETSSLLFQQVKELGETAIQNSIAIVNEETGFVELSTTIQGSHVLHTLNVPIDEPYVMAKAVAAWKLKSRSLTLEFVGQELKIYNEYRNSFLETKISFPEDRWIVNISFFSKGWLSFSSNKNVSNEIIVVQQRFAAVFDQTYTRFLDLKKAEAQAREAKIEAALEKVRSRSLAMRKTDELAETASLLFRQLELLSVVGKDDRISISIIDEETGDAAVWITMPGGGEKLADYYLPMKELKYYNSKYLQWKKLPRSQRKEFLLFNQIEGDELTEFINFIDSHTDFSQDNTQDIEKITQFDAFFSHGVLTITGVNNLGDSSQNVLKRFAAVFEQTYTRFLDLQRAEAQAREAQIQLALERVRARTMAMYHSEELAQTAAVLFEQLSALGNEPARISIGILDEENALVNFWATDQEGDQISTKFNARINEETTIAKMYAGWKTKLKSLSIELRGKDLTEWIRFCREEMGIIVKDELLQQQRIHTVGYFSKGWINYTTHTIPSSETVQILERFTAMFNYTYTRFLDLQKAEAQAREAQIQLGLERVRAKAMAMQNSEELNGLVGTVFEELTRLDFVLFRCLIMIFDPQTLASRWWMANSEAPSNPRNFLVQNHDNPAYDAYRKAWHDRVLTWQYELKGKVKRDWDSFLFVDTELAQLPDAVINGMTSPERVLLSASFNNFGCLTLVSNEPLSAEHSDIMLRFAKVFDMSYTRFNDLKQAEAQTKEAKIEGSLERVRSKTMAMHNSQDVADTVVAMFDELVKLGVDKTVRSGIAIIENGESMELWTASSNPNEQTALTIGSVSVKIHPLLKNFYKAWKNKEQRFSYELSGEDLKNYYQALNNAPDYPVQFDIEKLPSKLFHNTFIFPEGAIFVFSLEALTVEVAQVYKRFAGVFGLTYRRFLDLKKAEAQVKEAKIEAGLEKVRSRTMAMQKSDELAETASEVFKQLMGQGIAINRLYIGIIHDESDDIELWATDEDGSRVSTQFTANLNRNRSINKMYEGWKLGKKSITIDMQGKELKDYFKYLINELKVPLNLGLLQKRRVQHLAYFSQGCIGMASPDVQPNETIKLLERFAGVFNLTYTRFNDLKQAEAQTRESQIEAALERVRGRAMAMHSSKDLSFAANMVFTELRKLGINPIRCGVGLLNKTSRKALLYSATTSDESDALSLIGWVELSGHPVLENIYDTWLSNENYFPVLNGEQLRSYYELLLAGLQVPSVPDAKSGEQQYGHFLPFAEGCVYAWSDKQYSDSEVKILDRFKGIISLTFRRYFELQQSETSARDAIRQSSLDRVRAEIASMRTVDDLKRITPLIWNELTVLGIPFIRCGVFIMDEQLELIHCYLSTPDGKALTSFKLPFNSEGITRNALLSWRKKQIFTNHWSEEEFAAYISSQVEHGVIGADDKYVTEHPNTSLDLHFFPFLQGMLYVGNITPLNEGESNLVQSLSDAFSTAYARYEDFNKLEIAKQQVENTLTELKAAQTKLIQSEKMASLGELTAGIAHEIQNPLNFVNNFSEVNQEMIDELEEELKSGNIEEALAIAADIKQNEKKINHHGKRADGIVKGMLQHSRSSSGDKQSTNINTLADEFMRLAYHGLRAKDKSFNAEMVTHFDENLPKVDVVQQDIGRVLLNLFNNAFYTVNQKQKTVGVKYKPEVTITTYPENNHIVIKVKDNGMGISNAIKDKIMQPFFTTKPTGEGTGLGLSLTYDMVVKGHGGSIQINSIEGEGSEFIIQLPTTNHII